MPDGTTGPVLDPHTSANTGRGIVTLSEDVWLVLMVNVDELANANPRTQRLFVRASERKAEVHSFRVSEDVHNVYFLPTDWGPRTHLILEGQSATCNSCWSWGVPLVAISGDTVVITVLHTQMLFVSNVYAWHPTRVGWIAIASSRYPSDVTHLTLLKSGDFCQLTHPRDAIGDWAHWTTDGTRLFYARELADHSELHVVSVEGKTDTPLITDLPIVTHFLSRVRLGPYS